MAKEPKISQAALNVPESQLSVDYNTLADGGDIPRSVPNEFQEQRDREDHIYKDFSIHPEFKKFLDRYNKRYDTELSKLKDVDKDGLAKQQARVSAYGDVLKELSGYERKARKLLNNSH